MSDSGEEVVVVKTVNTPPSQKKMKQARLPFAPINKGTTKTEPVSKKRKLSGQPDEEPKKAPRTEEQAEGEVKAAEVVADKTANPTEKAAEPMEAEDAVRAAEGETKENEAEVKPDIDAKPAAKKRAKPKQVKAKGKAKEEKAVAVDAEAVDAENAKGEKEKNTKASAKKKAAASTKKGQDEKKPSNQPKSGKSSVRVKMSFGKSRKSSDDKPKDSTDSDIDDIEFESKESSMTEDWARYHQEEMQKQKEEDGVEFSEENKVVTDLVTDTDLELASPSVKNRQPAAAADGKDSEKKKQEETPTASTSETPKRNRKKASVTPTGKAKKAGSATPASKANKADGTTPASSTGAAASAAATATPKSTKNPLDRFLVRMKPGESSSPKAAASPASKKLKLAADSDEKKPAEETSKAEGSEKDADNKKADAEEQEPSKSDAAEKPSDTKEKADGEPEDGSSSGDNMTASSATKVTSEDAAKPAALGTPKTQVESLKKSADTPAGQTPQQIRAKRMAVAKLKVRIIELNVVLEKAVAKEEFLQAHELKEQIQSLEQEMQRIESEGSFTSYSPAVADHLKAAKEKEALGEAAESTPKRKASSLVETPSTDAKKASTSTTPTSTGGKKKAKAAKVSTPGAEGGAAASPQTPSQPSPSVQAGKKLTPKQLAKQEEKRLKAEAQEKERLEKEKKKQDLKAQKEREKEEKERQKEEKERQKEEEKRNKELERLEKERIKKEKDAERELEKQRKKLEKEAEAKRKEEEKLKAAEEEKEKQRKKAEAFKQFFVVKKPDAAKDGAGAGGAAGTDGGDQDQPEAVGSFNPFQVKKNMRMAPVLRGDPMNARNNIDSLEGPSGPSHLYLEILKRGEYKPGHQGKTWPFRKVEEDNHDSDVEICEEDDEEDEEDKMESTIEITADNIIMKKDEAGLQAASRAKLLQFHDNKRPAYWGTWKKKSDFVGPRRPFGRDMERFNYEVDSDDDWEEEEQGESLSDAEDDKEEEDDYEVDNEFFVPHGYLSDDENKDEEEENFNPETAKEKLKLKEKEFEAEHKKKTQILKPKLWGCYWEDEEEDTEDSAGLDTGTAAKQLLKILTSYSAIPCCNNNVPIHTPLTKPCSSPSTNNTGGVLGSVTSSAVAGSRSNMVLKQFPEEATADLIRLVHANSNNKIFLSREFIEFWKKKTAPDSLNDAAEEADRNEDKDSASTVPSTVAAAEAGGGASSSLPSTPSTRNSGGVVISKRKVIEKIQEIATYRKLTKSEAGEAAKLVKAGRFWMVAPEIVDKYFGGGSGDQQQQQEGEKTSANADGQKEEDPAAARATRPGFPNEWSYILDQPNKTAAANMLAASGEPGDSPAASRPGSPVGGKSSSSTSAAGGQSPNPASLITKFTKKLSQEEMAKNMRRKSTAKSAAAAASAAANKKASTPLTARPIAIKKTPSSAAGKPVQPIAVRRTPNNRPSKNGASSTPPVVKPVNQIAIKRKPAATKPLDPANLPTPLRRLPPGISVTTAAASDSEVEASPKVMAMEVDSAASEDECITLD